MYCEQLQNSSCYITSYDMSVFNNFFVNTLIFFAERER